MDVYITTVGNRAPAPQRCRQVEIVTRWNATPGGKNNHARFHSCSVILVRRSPSALAASTVRVAHREDERDAATTAPPAHPHPAHPVHYAARSRSQALMRCIVRHLCGCLELQRTVAALRHKSLFPAGAQGTRLPVMHAERRAGSV